MPTTLITGANRGIGLAFARRLAADGHAVIATARRPEAAEELLSTGARVEGLDVTDPGSVRALAERLAGEPIDVLINNAAVFIDRDVSSGLETTAEQLMETYRVNAAGPMLVTQALLPNVEASGRKLVVYISSDYASIAKAGRDNWHGNMAYRSSKSALSMIHALLANELRPRGVTCLALHPGWVQTDMGGPDATLTPEASVDAMLAVIDRATLADSGRLIAYTGEPVDW